MLKATPSKVSSDLSINLQQLPFFCDLPLTKELMVIEFLCVCLNDTFSEGMTKSERMFKCSCALVKIHVHTIFFFENIMLCSGLLNLSSHLLHVPILCLYLPVLNNIVSMSTLSNLKRYHNSPYFLNCSRIKLLFCITPMKKAKFIQ